MCSSRIFCLVRVNRLAIAASVVKKAFAISAALNPQSVFSASAICDSCGTSLGRWQAFRLSVAGIPYHGGHCPVLFREYCWGLPTAEFPCLLHIFFGITCSTILYFLNSHALLELLMSHGNEGEIGHNRYL